MGTTDNRQTASVESAGFRELQELMQKAIERHDTKMQRFLNGTAAQVYAQYFTRPTPTAFVNLEGGIAGLESTAYRTTSRNSERVQTSPVHGGGREDVIALLAMVEQSIAQALESPEVERFLLANDILRHEAGLRYIPQATVRDEWLKTCVIDPALRTQAKLVYSSFEQFCWDRDWIPCNRRDLKRYLSSRGFERIKNSELYWQGLGLRQPDG